MSILIHNKSNDGTYCTYYLYVNNKLNWDNYFQRIFYLGTKSSYDIFLIGKLGVYTSGDNLYLMTNGLVERNSASDLGGVMKVGSYFADFAHLIIFKTTGELNTSYEDVKTYKINNQNYDICVRKTNYTNSNKLESGRSYLAFLEYTPNVPDYDMEYYSTNPRRG